MKNILKKDKGITLVALVTTIIILLILAGVTIGTLTNKKGLINQANENSYSAQKETIIEKIEADLYSEKIKTGTTPSKSKLEELASKYGNVANDTITITDEGEVVSTIDFNEIAGWK